MIVPAFQSTGPVTWVRRKTTLLTDAEVARMVAACHRQSVEHLCPAWGRLPGPVRVLKPGTRKPAADYLLDLCNASAAGSLGYHEELAGDVVTGVIGVGTVLDNGGTKFDGELSVSAVLSHEVCETIINPQTSGWADSGQGWLVALEVSDPVQGDAYQIDGVSVSDFVTPDFFSPVVSRGDKFDWMGVLPGPFKIAKGGYVLNYEAGDIKTYFGAVQPPEWLMEMKDNGASRSRRLKDHLPV